jgi:hypothetical protein
MGLIGDIRTHALACLIGLAAISLIGLFLLVPPVRQPQAYHQFADQRMLFGIPNFWNVTSNLPFILVGAAGLPYLRRDVSAGVFFLGVFLTGFSSSYYHWHPDDAGLFWDRLPMTFAFTAILANVVEERIDARTGRALLWPLVALGIVSLLVWRWTGDLRLYGWVQFFPCVTLLLMFVLLPPKYTGTGWWFLAAGLYVAAKLLEYFDHTIDSALGFSGHPLKHVSAGCACLAILWAFHTRRLLA